MTSSAMFAWDGVREIKPMTPEQVSQVQGALNVALARRDAATSYMSAQAVEELTAFYEAGMQKVAAARITFEERGEWLLESIWERTEVWVPLIRSDRRPCFASLPGHLTYRCGRPEGHTGRHATIEFRSFASGGLHSRPMRRVLAVWP